MGRHRVFHLIDRFLRLLLTLRVSASSAERAFSALKIIKTMLHNKIKDNFFINNMMIHIESELLEDYSYEDIIKDFNDVKDRKVDFW
jgi:spore germination protein YaaH